MATTRIMPLHVGKGRTESRAISDIIDYVAGSLTVGYQKKVPAGRIKPAFFVSNFWFLSIVFYCNVL